MKMIRTFLTAAAMTAATLAAVPATAQDPGPMTYSEALSGKLGEPWMPGPRKALS